MEGNSHKERNELKEQNEKKFEAVVSEGDVRLKPQSGVKKVARNFLAEDFSTVKNRVVEEIVFPTIKETIIDMVQTGIELLVNGGTSHRRHRRRDRNDRESYTRYYDDRDRDRERERPYRRREELFDEDDVTFKSKAAAHDVWDRMCEIIDQYEAVSVSNLYDLLGKTCHNYLAASWGWDDLSNASISRTYDGWYTLNLPRAKYLR